MSSALTENLQPPRTASLLQQEHELIDAPEFFGDDGFAPHDSPRLSSTTPLELCTPESLARLRLIGVFWPAWSAQTRQLWLECQEISVAPRALAEPDIAVLPGGAIAVRGPDRILVCDPAEAVTFSEAQTKALRSALRRRADATHLLHLGGGVVQAERLPKVLPPQAVTIVQEAVRLPGRLAIAGPALIHWCLKGAVAWPLAEAPEALALAASVAASPIPRRGLPVAAELWHAPDAASRSRLLRPGIAEHASDLLGEDVPDELRHAIVEACIAGRNTVTGRTAAALAMLPACFQADASARPGDALGAWAHGMTHVQAAAHPRAWLGIEDAADPLALLRALRNCLDHADVLVIAEDGAWQHAGPVALWDDAALFLGRRMPPYARLGLIMPVPAAPVDFYALAGRLAEHLDMTVTAAAPCWGFCHRIGPDGTEAGNAGWFGMGVGLDEIDAIVADLGLFG